MNIELAFRDISIQKYKETIRWKCYQKQGKQKLLSSDKLKGNNTNTVTVGWRREGEKAIKVM